MQTPIKIVLIGLTLLIASIILSWAANLINQPSDFSVGVGVLTICATFIGGLALLLRILKGQVESNEVSK